MKVRRTFRYNISSTKVFIIHGLSIVILHFIRLLINGCLLSTSRFLAKGFISTSMQLSLSFKAALSFSSKAGLSFSSKAFSLSLFSLAFCYSACFFSRSAFFLANCSTSAILFFVDSSSSSSLPSFFFVLFPVLFFLFCLFGVFQFLHDNFSFHHFLFITCKLTHFQPSKRYPLTVK